MPQKDDDDNTNVGDDDDSSNDSIKVFSTSSKKKKRLISRVPDQNGVSLLYIMLEIHHSGREPLICCQ